MNVMTRLLAKTIGRIEPDEPGVEKDKKNRSANCIKLRPRSPNERNRRN